MLILSVDSSASPASVCLFQDNKILSEYYINVGLTHSQTLVAMIESMLTVTGIKSEDIDLYAVNSGPGSFTQAVYRRIDASQYGGELSIRQRCCLLVYGRASPSGI